MADAAIARLAEMGYVDDRRFAERFAADRRRLDGWGSERIERRLLELGVDREIVAAELAGVGAQDELAAALALLERRFPEPPEDPRDRDRAFGLLVRRGYEPELAAHAIRAHRRGSDRA